MMKYIAVLFALLWCLTPLAAQDMQISGLFDSTVSLEAGTGDAEAFSYGIEEYANLRVRADIGDYARFYGAFNLIAGAGTSLNTATVMSALNAATTGLSASPYIAGDNYAAAMELERLYVQVNSNALDLVTGLMPLHFGYGQVFGPSDFLNPRNVLFPDARARGIIGASAAFYYPESAKVRAFAAAPQRLTSAAAINSAGEGFRFGLAADNDWNWGSVQALYVFETPQSAAPDGRHQMGLSIKADVELGLVMDALYTYDHAAGNDALNGLSASAGFDYSLLDGDFYVLAEYLYNGASSITARSAANPSGLVVKRHYAYALCRYMFSDYTNVSLSCMVGIEDASFLPTASFYHELFQGMGMRFSAQFPLAIEEDGEFAPRTMGRHFSFTTKVSFRF